MSHRGNRRAGVLPARLQNHGERPSACSRVCASRHPLKLRRQDAGGACGSTTHSVRRHGRRRVCATSSARRADLRQVLTHVRAFTEEPAGCRRVLACPTFHLRAAGRGVAAAPSPSKGSADSTTRSTKGSAGRTPAEHRVFARFTVLRPSAEPAGCGRPLACRTFHLRAAGRGVAAPRLRPGTAPSKSGDCHYFRSSQRPPDHGPCVESGDCHSSFRASPEEPAGCRRVLACPNFRCR